MPKMKGTESGKGKGSTVSGWDAVAKRKEARDEAQERSNVPDFWLKDGETAVVQFLDAEPYCFDAHQFKTKKGYFTTKACQLVKQKHCLLCDEGMKLTWKAGFKILDYRGDWDKEKNKFKKNKQVEKLWTVSNTLALQIRGLIDKVKTGVLTDAVFEVTRTGAGAKDTSYNFSIAYDDETEKRMKPIDFEQEHGSAEELCKPPTDGELIAMGFEGNDD